MPPQLALLLSLALSAFLLRRELKQQPVSSAVWVPCIWLLILSSRSISQWLNLGTPNGSDALMEGSPHDRMFFTCLIASAMIIVWRRRISWRQVWTSNRLLVVYFLYCAISVLWSDFPLIASKRWFKSLGEPLMVMVVLSEAHPVDAIASVIRRCAFLLVPLSIVFIKYYPYLGRDHDIWSGQMFYTGVATNKNMLGYSLFVFGLLFLCTLFTRVPKIALADRSARTARRTDVAIAVLLLSMIAYLFHIADSKTPLVALCVAGGIVASLGLPAVRNHFGSFAAAVVTVGVVLQLLFSVSEIVFESTGRDATFTGRTEVWAVVLAMATNPLLGAGFQSFWLGERLQAMWDLYAFRPNQAHNGYIEVYLNLGIIGLALFCGILLSAYRTVKQRLEESDFVGGTRIDELVFAKFGVAYFVAYVFYNVTEAVFQPLNLLFVIFLSVIIRYPTRQPSRVAVHAAASGPSVDPAAHLAAWHAGPRTGEIPAGRRDLQDRPAKSPGLHTESRWALRRGSHRPAADRLREADGGRSESEADRRKGENVARFRR